MASLCKGFRCGACDREICDETFSCTLRKGGAYVSGVLDCVQKRGQGKKLALVCSCGENVGDFVAYKKDLKYCLDLGKVKSVRSANNCDTENVQLQPQTGPTPTDLVAPTLSKKVDGTSNKRNISTLCREEAERGNEVVQLKQTVAALEGRLRSMEKDNEEKLKDVCGMLLSQKLEIQRLQEIIWALHPNINLNSAFIVNDKASYFDPGSDISLGGLNVEED